MDARNCRWKEVCLGGYSSVTKDLPAYHIILHRVIITSYLEKALEFHHGGSRTTWQVLPMKVNSLLFARPILGRHVLGKLLDVGWVIRL